MKYMCLYCGNKLDENEINWDPYNAEDLKAAQCPYCRDTHCIREVEDNTSLFNVEIDSI